MTTKELQAVSDCLLGTPDSIESALEGLGIEGNPDDVEALLEIERCDGCDWWCEPSELVDEHGDVVGCEDCRKPEEED